MLIKVHPEYPAPRAIAQAVDRLEQGGLIIYPTDTAYGLGCSIYNKKSIERVYIAKGKDRKKPLSFVCSSLKDVDKYAVVSNTSYRLLRRYLPGPYTFVLEATRLVPKIMLTKRKTVGIRVPQCPVARELVEALGHPIISTSVEPVEGILNDPQMIHRNWGGKVDFVIDGGVIPYQMSSVIDLTEEVPRVLRQGIGDVEEFL